MSERFARERAAVVRAARSADQMKETAAVISATGTRAIAIVCDAGVEGDVRRTAAIAVKGFGKLDTLVNNAGDAGPTKAVQGYLGEDQRYTIDSCLTSSHLCIRFKAGHGAIVNISSEAERRGLPFRIGSCSAKAGQVGMALALAPHNIRVNCVAPGAVEGERIDRADRRSGCSARCCARADVQGRARSRPAQTGWLLPMTSSPACSSAATWHGASQGRCSP